MCYTPTLRGGFAYDSVAQIVNGDYIHNSSHWRDVLTLRVLGEDELDRNRPLLLASLMADAAAWGREPFGYRLTSVLLHALNAALLCALIAGALATDNQNRPAAAVCGALFFALHPLVVEAVAEPSNREDLLMLLVTLIGLLAIQRTASHPERRWISPNVIIAACAFLAVTAKESGIATPLIFAAAIALYSPSHWHRWIPGLVSGATSAGAFLVASYLLRPLHSDIFVQAPQPLADGFWASLGVQCRIWTLQLSQIVWPGNLSGFYPPQAIAHIALVAALIVLGIMCAAALRAARLSRLAALGIAVFVLALLPASNVAPQFQPVADRYLYAPLAGLGMVIAAFLSHLIATRKRQQWAVLAAAVVIALLLSVNIQRQHVWQQSMTVWTNALSQFPQLPIAYLGISGAHYRNGDYAQALEAAKTSAMLTGNRWQGALTRLSLCQWQTGDHDAAVITFRRAMDVGPADLSPEPARKSLSWPGEQLEILRKLHDAAVKN